jgi:putative peptidoglycan lipid II flippase
MKSSPADVAYALSFGVLLGGLLQVIVHLITIKKLNLHKLLIGGIKYRDKKDVKQEIKSFNRLFVPSIVGNSTPQISAFIDTILASFLISGSVSYLFYANRIFQLPLAIFAIATSTALFPSISKALKNNQEEQAYKNLKKAFWFLLFLLSGAMIGGILLAEPIIWLLFERGKFTLTQTHQTMSVLQMYMIGLIPFGLSKLFSMFLYASHKHKKTAIFAIYSLIVSVTSSLILMRYMGAMGLALAGSIGGWVLFYFTVKEVGFERLKSIIKGKYIIYYLTTIVIFATLIYYLNIWLVHLIR